MGRTLRDWSGTQDALRWWAVQIHGHDFQLERDDGPPITGYFTTRGVRAESRDRAIEEALQKLNWEVNSAPELTPLSDAVISVSRCRRVSAQVAERIPTAGFTFY